MQNEPPKKTTHFGYQEIPIAEKEQMVGDVFRSVAAKYDVMNDFMSLGLHRLWKRFTIAKSDVRGGQRILDVASCSGDLVKLFAERVGSEGQVIATDINEKMLSRGRDRLTDKGVIGNVTDQAAALRSMYRVLKPGGKLLVLEFSKPHVPGLHSLYDFYSFNVIPKLGEIICHDRERSE